MVPRAHISWELWPLLVFQILPFLKIFVTIKARKLEVCINIDSNWMYCVYQSKGQGSITLGVISLVVTLGVMSLGRFSKN